MHSLSVPIILLLLLLPPPPDVFYLGSIRKYTRFRNFEQPNASLIGTRVFTSDNPWTNPIPQYHRAFVEYFLSFPFPIVNGHIDNDRKGIFLFRAPLEVVGIFI
jgi:hypothetical protein